MISIKGGKANQPVHTMLRPEIAIGMNTSDLQHGTLYPCFFSGRGVQNLGTIAPPFCPSEIHPHHPLRPALRLGPPGTRMDTDQSVSPVILTTEKQLKIKPVQIGGYPVDFRPYFPLQRHIFFPQGYFNYFHQVICPMLQFTPSLRLFLKGAESPHRLISLSLILPEIGLARLLLYFSDFLFLLRYVKDAHSWQRFAFADLPACLSHFACPVSPPKLKNRQHNKSSVQTGLACRFSMLVMVALIGRSAAVR